VIEPALYFAHLEDAPRNFASAVEAWHSGAGAD